MNDFYNKNMEALKKYSPRTSNYIRDKIADYENNKDAKPVLDDKEAFAEKGLFEDIDIEVEKAYDDSPIFRVKKGNVFVYLNGKRDPNAIAKRWTEHFDLLPRTTPIIMFGIGNGSFLLEIEKKLKEEVKIFIYEPSLQIFLKCLHETDLSKVIEKRKLIIGLDDNISYDQIRGNVKQIVTMANLEFMRVFILPGYAMLYPNEAKKFMELVKKPAKDEMVGHATRVMFSNIAVTTILYNAMYLPDCYSTFQLAHVIPRDIPAIVVAAGPSLNKNIKELKAAKNKAFIIAVDTAIRPLLKEGIVPDMFTIVDATKPIDLVKLPGVEDIPLLAAIASAQEVLAFHTGKKFFYDEDFRFINKAFSICKKDFKPVSSGGSVATVAFSLSFMVGIDTIILMGQDLALTNNRTHADGTFQEEMEEIDTSKMRMVPGNVEEMVPTRGDFFMYLEWYRDYIAHCKKYRPAFRVINATEGGARIEGTEVMTLKEAIKETCKRDVDIKSLIDGIDPIFMGDDRKKVVEYLNSTEDGFRKIAENAETQKKIYKKIDNMTKGRGIPMKEYKKLLDKLKKLNKEVLRSPLYDLVDDSLIDARLALEKELLIEEDSILDEAKEISRKGLIYMDLVAQCANLLGDVAANSVSLVK